MQEKARLTTWGEIATLEYGKGIRGYKDAIGDYPVYGTNGQVGWHHEPLCSHPGVIVGRKGVYRGIHYSKRPFYVIDTAFYLSPKVKMDLRWAYYELLTHDINSMDSGSAIPSTSRENFYGLPVLFPPYEEQLRIVEILGSFDDKIELNRRMNETLEGMTRALYKSWFVDFDPVIDKALAAGNPIPEEFRERAARRAALGDKRKPFPSNIASLFPDSFTDSALGPIPEGWRVGAIKDCGSIVTGKTPKTKISGNFGQIMPFITPSDITDQLIITKTSRYLSKKGIEALKKNLINPGSICITCIGSQMGKVTLSPFKAVTNQQINSIIPIDKYFGAYILVNLRQRRSEMYRIGSSGSTMPILNKSTFSKLSILLPNTNLLEHLYRIIWPLLNQWELNDNISKSLAALRNKLLPKLLSGEINMDSMENVP